VPAPAPTHPCRRGASGGAGQPPPRRPTPTRHCSRTWSTSWAAGLQSLVVGSSRKASQVHFWGRPSRCRCHSPARPTRGCAATRPTRSLEALALAISRSLKRLVYLGEFYVSRPPPRARPAWASPRQPCAAHATAGQWPSLGLCRRFSPASRTGNQTVGFAGQIRRFTLFGI